MRTTLHTRLYTPDSLKLIKIMGKAFYYHWSTGQMKSSIRRFDYAEVAPDREVILPNTSVYYESSLWNKSENEILKWMAIHLKLAVKKDGHEWFRGNNEEVSCLSDEDFKVTVSDAYLIYDLWLQRRNIEFKFSKSQLERWVGIPADPITTEIEVARRQEIKDVEDRCNKAISALQEEKRRKDNDFYKKTAEEFQVAMQKLVDERDAKLAELRAQDPSKTAA